jgi:ClpP class serine protease
MWGVAAPMAYSAGYLLLSCAETIYTPQVTGGVGSIGVYMMHMDLSQYLANLGIKPTFISAGKGKTDGNPYEPLSKAAFDKYTAEVNRLYGEFVTRVATSRQMAESAIIKFGAALFEGSKSAIGSGLADRAGTPDLAITELAARVAAKSSGANAHTQAGGKMDNPNPTPTPAPAAAAPPAVVDIAKITAEATTAGYGAAAEVVELCQLAGLDMTQTAAFVTGKKPVAEVRRELLKLKAEKNAAPGEIQNGVLSHEAALTDKPKKSLKERNVEQGRAEGWLQK